MLMVLLYDIERASIDSHCAIYKVTLSTLLVNKYLKWASSIVLLMMCNNATQHAVTQAFSLHYNSSTQPLSTVAAMHMAHQPSCRHSLRSRIFIIRTSHTRSRKT